MYVYRGCGGAGEGVEDVAGYWGFGGGHSADESLRVGEWIEMAEARKESGREIERKSDRREEQSLRS